MTDRINAGLCWLTEEISATRQEFRSAHGRDGDALLDGLLSHGYVREDRGRFAVTPIGFLRMGPVEEEVEEDG